MKRCVEREREKFDRDRDALFFTHMQFVVFTLLFSICIHQKITSQNNGKLEFHNERDRRQGVRARERGRDKNCWS